MGVTVSDLLLHPLSSAVKAFSISPLALKKSYAVVGLGWFVPPTHVAQAKLCGSREYLSWLRGIHHVRRPFPAQGHLSRKLQIKPRQGHTPRQSKNNCCVSAGELRGFQRTHAAPSPLSPTALLRTNGQAPVSPDFSPRAAMVRWTERLHARAAAKRRRRCRPIPPLAATMRFSRQPNQPLRRG